LRPEPQVEQPVFGVLVLHIPMGIILQTRDFPEGSWIGGGDIYIGAEGRVAGHAIIANIQRPTELIVDPDQVTSFVITKLKGILFETIVYPDQPSQAIIPVLSAVRFEAGKTPIPELEQSGE
jgi:hypothetical protein